ncbi:MAG: thioredoxin family protein [Sulfurospirillum sp.]
MKIEILGTGCAKCKALEEVVKQATAKIGGFHSVEKVEDIMKIMEYGVVSTPGLVVDGKVVSTGKLLSVNEVIDILKGL